MQSTAYTKSCSNLSFWCFTVPTAKCRKNRLFYPSTRGMQSRTGHTGDGREKGKVTAPLCALEGICPTASGSVGLRTVRLNLIQSSGQIFHAILLFADASPLETDYAHDLLFAKSSLKQISVELGCKAAL